LGVITQYKWAKRQIDYKPDKYVLPMGRGKVKNHGKLKDMYFLGVPKGRTIVIEDVTTTGESLVMTIDNLLKIDVPVIAAIGLTDRNEVRDDGKSVEKIIEERNIPYYAMSNALDLLPEVYERMQPDEIIARRVEEYFEKYGVEKLKLIENK